MDCNICGTELERDLKRGCSFCPACHPQTKTEYESREEEISFLKERLAELEGTVVSDPDTEREELAEKLTELGIEFHHKCGVNKLKQLLKENSPTIGQ